jgi:protein phosphatase
VGEDKAFLAAIQAKPADDLVRLVYADWLDERDDPRGEFLRLECRLHGMTEADQGFADFQRQLWMVGQLLDTSWVATVSRVTVDLGGTTMTPAAWIGTQPDWVVTAGGVSAIGGYRERNEDLVVLHPNHPIAVVLDGMGGDPGGERAAVVGGESLRRALAEGPDKGESAEEYIRRSLRAANEPILALQRDPELRGAGATVVLAALHAGRVFVSWIGDAMAYRVSGDHVEQLTRPHDFRNHLIRTNVLSETEAREQLIRNVLLHWLGTELPDPIEVPSFTPQPGDRLILVTNAVDGLLPASDIVAACRRHRRPLPCAEHLVRLALDRGSRDNATCVVIAFNSPHDQPELRANDGPSTQKPEPRANRPWWRFW